MPYINQKDRTKFSKVLHKIPVPVNAGEFNYLVTKLALTYLEVNGLNYQKMNDLLGALEGIKLELYRRCIATYEDKKIKENGDV